MKLYKLIISTILIILSGCNSKMNVSKETTKDEKPVGGIPFKMTETFVKAGYRNTHSKAGSVCVPSPFTEIVALPTGETYYVNVKMGAFADGGLTFKANPNGTVQEIAMTSKPDSSAIDSFTGALSSLLPFAGILPKEVKVPDPDPGTSTTGLTALRRATGAVIPSCDSGEANVQFHPFNKDIQYHKNEDISGQVDQMKSKLDEIKNEIKKNSAPAPAGNG